MKRDERRTGERRKRCDKVSCEDSEEAKGLTIAWLGLGNRKCEYRQ